MVDQNSQFYAILTNVGAAKQANADALGIPWKITAMGIGDANGADPLPNAGQTKLIAEWRRAPLNQLKVDDKDPSIIVAEQVIPADVGGRWIREIALYDADGDMVAVANCAPTYKPLLTQGSGRTQVVRVNLIVSSSSNVQLKIDPSVVLATREYVDIRISERRGYNGTSPRNTGGAITPAEAGKMIYYYGERADQTLTLPAAASLRVGGTINLQNVSSVPVTIAKVATDTLQIGGEGGRIDSLVLYPGSELEVTCVSNYEWFAQGTGALHRMNGLPTLPVGTANGQLSTAAFVQQELVASRGDSAPLPDGAATPGVSSKSAREDHRHPTDQTRAPLISPAFGGWPTANTPATGSRNSQIATTAFVGAELAGLIDAAPGALDTLNELAEALGNDPNFAATMSYHLSLKAPLASPALTGVPTAPTAATGQSTGQLSTTAFVQQELAASRGVAAPLMDGIAAPGVSVKSAREDHRHPTDITRAPLDSPAFAGWPTANTPALGSSNAQLATTAFVSTAIAALVNAAPGALDTLNELAAALGNDPNFAATMNYYLSLKAPLASPAFSGAPTTPLAALFDDSQAIASTAFVKRHGSQYSGVSGYTASRQLLATDAGKLVYFAGSTAGQYFLLPAAIELPLGGRIAVQNVSGVPLAVTRTNGDFLHVSGEQLTTISIPPGGEAVFTRANVSAWYITGSATLGKMASFASQKSAAGWEQSPSGIITQWGTAANGEMANGTMIVLPTTFPTDHFLTIACAINTTGEIESAYTGDLTLSGFRLFTQSQAATGGAWSNSVVAARFISIGI